MQGEFQATTQRESIDEREGRHPGCVQLVEDGMADPGDGQGLVAADDLGESGEVGACREREWLSSDRDRDDVVAGQSQVKGPVQLAEPMCAQGIRSSVTTAVVKRDQHRGSRGVRQR